MKKYRLPVLLAVIGGVLFAQWAVLDFTSPLNNETAPAWAVHLADVAPHAMWKASLVLMWAGLLIFIAGLLMLIIRIKKNDENIHRGRS